MPTATDEVLARLAPLAHSGPAHARALARYLICHLHATDDPEAEVADLVDDLHAVWSAMSQGLAAARRQPAPPLDVTVVRWYAGPDWPAVAVDDPCRAWRRGDRVDVPLWYAEVLDRSPDRWSKTYVAGPTP